MMIINELFNIKGKNVIITGGNKGIGRAISYGMAQAGANIAIAARNIDISEKVCKEIEGKYPVNTLAIKTDVSSKKSVDRMVSKVIEAFGQIDVLVSNAGIINRPRQDAVEINEDLWDRIIEVNLKGTFLVCSRVAKEMIPRRKGKIICMASIMSKVAQRGHSPYIASKGGIYQFVKALALELAPYNIQVNALGPHYFRSEMTEASLQNKKRLKMIIDKIPLGRVGEPEDLVGSCIYLASKASDLVTGHLLMVDGGYTIL